MLPVPKRRLFAIAATAWSIATAWVATAWSIAARWGVASSRVVALVVGILHVAAVGRGHLLDFLAVAVVASDVDGGACQLVLDVDGWG